jgi:hypothetical protein
MAINLQDRIKQMKQGRTQSNLGGIRNPAANMKQFSPQAQPMDAAPWRTMARPQPMDATPWRTQQGAPVGGPMDATPWRTRAPQSPNPANAVGGNGVQFGSSMTPNPAQAPNPNNAAYGGPAVQFGSAMTPNPDNAKYGGDTRTHHFGGSGGSDLAKYGGTAQQFGSFMSPAPQISGALPAGTDINPMSATLQTGGQPKQAAPQMGSNEHINQFAQEALRHGYDPATIAQFIKGRLFQQQ